MADNLQWTSIADFTPGIHSVISPNHPDGAASPDGTFGCHALVGGALGPLPRVNQTISAPIPSFPALSSILTEEFRVVGLHVRGPVYWDPKALNGEDQSNTEIFVGVEWWTNQPGDTDDNQWLKFFRYRRNWAAPEWQEIYSTSKRIEPYNQFKIPPTADMHTTRSNNGDPSQSGPTVLAVSCYGHTFMWPDDTNPAVNATRWLPGDINNDPLAFGLIAAVNIVPHQGRLVTFPLSIQNSGNETLWVTNEHFFWSNVNDLRTVATAFAAGGGDYYQINVGWENPTGYHVMESLTADELFLIKSKGGGMVLRGDLDDFTAINYPYVRSTGFSINRGTPTPLGFVYPVDGSGVWMWTGGQVSENLTDHLENDFWRPPRVSASGTSINFLHYPSQCSQWGEWVLFPNNYLWDTDPKSEASPRGAWWRIADPEDFIIHRWAVDWRNVMAYGTPSGFRTGSTPIVYEFDRKAPGVTSYRWASHPISSTLEREVTLREVVMVTSGEGKVTVRAYTAEDPTGDTQEFIVSGTPARPTIQRHQFSVTGTQLAFEILADSTNDSEAPQIHELRYGLISGHLIVGN